MISADDNSGQNDEPIGILYDGMVQVYDIRVYFGRRIPCIEQFVVVMCGYMDVWMMQPCGSCRIVWVCRLCRSCGYVDRVVMWAVWMYGCVCLCE